MWQDDAVHAWCLLSWEDRAQWFATKESGGRKLTMGGVLRSLDELLATIRNAEALGWNFYLNANPVNAPLGTTKVSREHVTHWRYVTIDLDPTEHALVPPGNIDAAHRIFSGRGYQFWLPIEGSPELPAGETRAMIERGMQGYLRMLRSTRQDWAAGWSVDTACSDLARVVRCPGSVNQKTGRRAVVEGWPSADPVPMDGILKWATEVPEKPGSLPSPGGGLLVLLPFCNGTTARFLIGGVEAGERHRSCYAACRSLHELGVPSSTAIKLLTWGAKHCVPPIEDGFVERTVKRIYE